MDQYRGKRTYEWSEYEDESKLYVSMKVDQLTGNVLSIEYDIEKENEEERGVTIKEAKKKAIKILQQWLPADVKEVWLEPVDSRNRYVFDFNRIYKGAVVDGITYTVILGRLGEVEKVEINIGADFSQLPENHDILSPEEAAQIYVKASELSLAYVIDRQGTIDTSTQAPKLLFIPKHGGRAAGVDAFTGEMVFIR